MAISKSYGTTYSTSSVASNGRYYTGEFDCTNMEFATINAIMTHVGAAGGFTIIPIGKMAGAWFPVPSPIVIQGATGGIQTTVGNNPPYSSNFAPNAAFGYSRPMAYFISAPSAGQRISANIIINVMAYTKLVVCLENYASQQDNVAITIAGGSKF